jgi:uncharacterized protein YjbK
MNEEKEIKILLSPNQYDVVDRLFQWDKEYVQKNYYYGTVEDLATNKNRRTIRVREKLNKIYLQVKIPIEKKSSLHIQKEYKKQIDCIPEWFSKDELEQFTGCTIEKDVTLLGMLETKRKECHVFENIEICLDVNKYLGKVDYEVEIEFTGDIPTEVITMLKNHNIPVDYEIQGKFSRFLSEKNHESKE